MILFAEFLVGEEIEGVICFGVEIILETVLYSFFLEGENIEGLKSNSVVSFSLA